MLLVEGLLEQGDLKNCKNLLPGRHNRFCIPMPVIFSNEARDCFIFVDVL